MPKAAARDRAELFQSLSARQPLQIRKVLLALVHQPIVARLILGADEAVGPAALIGPHIEVALCSPDRLLDVVAPGLVEHPCRVGKDASRVCPPALADQLRSRDAALIGLA